MTTTLLPATWGCAHGHGALGNLIRFAEQETSKSDRFPQGDHEAAWAGHVKVYVGPQVITPGQPPVPAVVEAEWPKVRIVPLAGTASTIWAVGQPLTGAQRDEGVAAVMAQVGLRYDAVAYIYFLEKLAEIPQTRDFAELEAQAAKAGPICSGVMVREQEKMGVDLGPLKTAAIKDPDWVSPADGLRWMLDNKWNDRPVPAW